MIRFSGSVMERFENISEEKYVSVNTIVQQLVDKGLADMQQSLCPFISSHRNNNKPK
jgi:hypothetical protein